jgi:xanthine dehydrogenase accessory factor
VRVESSRRRLYRELVRLQQAGQRVVLATPLWFRGSAPLAADSRLLMRQDGSTLGTVGGGLLEAEVLRQAAEVLADPGPRVIEFDLTQDEAAARGMICGGRAAVLVEPIGPDDATEVFAAVAEAEAAGASAVLISVLQGEDSVVKLALLPEGRLVGPSVPAEAEQVLRELAKRACAEERPIFVEEPVRVHAQPLLAVPTACIFGAGHIGAVVAHLAQLVGFRVAVVDDREEFANAARFPQAEQIIVAPLEEAFAELAVSDRDSVVVVTRGHMLDEEAVALALGTPARYLGMIGSKRKVAAIRERLRARGFTDDGLARLHAPIGLPIGAHTVEEIAVSIVAELVAVRRAPR